MLEKAAVSRLKQKSRTEPCYVIIIKTMNKKSRNETCFVVTIIINSKQVACYVTIDIIRMLKKRRKRKKKKKENELSLARHYYDP